MNNLILTGFITAYSGLKEAVNSNYGKYSYVDFEFLSDDATPQTPVFHLTGEMAVTLSTCNLTPQTRMRLYFRVFSHEYANRDGEQRKYNELSIWKVELLDVHDEVTFSFRKKPTA